MAGHSLPADVGVVGLHPGDADGGLDGQLVEPLVLVGGGESLGGERLVDEDDGAAALEDAHRHRDLEGALQVVGRPVVEEALERAHADHNLRTQFKVVSVFLLFGILLNERSTWRSICSKKWKKAGFG